MYKLKKNRFNVIEYVIRVADNTGIPFDENNTDYQSYLRWVAEGNTPEPADEPN